MSRKQKKNSDRGFTLVEVLVAVVILAIVVVPLLNSFLTASRTNARAKRLMDATTAAQNVFEKLKGEKLDDFVADYSETQEKIMRADDPTIPQLDSKGEEMFRHIIPEKSKPGDFRITIDQREFLARVTVDPLDYTTKEGDAVGDHDYNSQLFSNISKMSPATNAFFIEDTAQSMDDKAAAELSQDKMDSTIDATKKSMSKEIKIDIEYNAATNLTEVFGTITYTSAEGATYTPVNRDNCYSNSSALSNSLSNVFLCYLPMYSPNSSKAAPKEKIIVNNPMDYPVDVFIAKQAAYDDTTSDVIKNMYAVELEVGEGNRAWDKPVTSITTNLKYEEGNTIASELTNISLNGPTSVPASMEKALGINKDLSHPDSAIRIYKVKVEIFGKDDDTYAEPLTTMEGTKIE